MQQSTSRTVIDTNTLVSAFINPHGTPNRVVRAWQEERLVMLVTSELIAEAKDVLHRPHILKRARIGEQEIESFLHLVTETAERVTPLYPLLIRSRDPNDDKFLAAALGGMADYLVTGDADLLDLEGDQRLGKLRIVTPHQFLDQLY